MKTNDDISERATRETEADGSKAIGCQYCDAMFKTVEDVERHETAEH